MAETPQYPLAWHVAVRLAGALLLGRQRSFQADAVACAARLYPPIRLLEAVCGPEPVSKLGAENISYDRPALLTVNHYYRPGFRAWWLALAVSALTPAPIRWVMTDAWTFPPQPLGRQREAVFHWLFERIARVYGFFSMPPMPPRPHETAARARAVRQVLAYARKAPRPLLALAPEGGDNLAGGLTWPPAGVGRFIMLLAELGLNLVPVGVYEDADGLCVRFGSSYRLELPSVASKSERDHQAAAVVMEHIAAQLPPHLHGDFGSQRHSR